MLNINKESVLNALKMNKDALFNRMTMPSLISQTLKIEGNLVSNGTMEIEGEIKGDIKGDIVTLRESAVVEGNIEANIVNIKGSFEGIILSNTINIAREAKVLGNLNYFSLSVEDGASINGKCKKIPKKISTKKILMKKESEN